MIGQYWTHFNTFHFFQIFAKYIVKYENCNPIKLSIQNVRANENFKIKFVIIWNYNCKL